MRAAIDQDQLSEEQLRTLKLVQEADLRTAFNEVLRERGIPLRVYGFQLGPELDAEYAGGEYTVGESQDAESIDPDPELMPEPGGCFCCHQDKVGGPCICYCC